MLDQRGPVKVDELTLILEKLGIDVEERVLRSKLKILEVQKEKGKPCIYLRKRSFTKNVCCPKIE